MSGDTDPEYGIPREGRDELNLAEFPLSLLSDRAPEGVKTVEYADRFTDRARGETFDRRVIITGSDKFGLTTAGDDLVLVGLIQLTREVNGFTDPRVEFSRYRLLQIMGWPDHRDSYDRVEMSLQRWLGLSIYYDRAWWDRQANRWSSVGFHILDNFGLTAGGRKAASSRAFFKWNDVPFASLKSGHHKPLDIELYFRGLTLPLARRLYRYLDKKFYHGKHEYELSYLAFEKAALSRNYNAGKLKSKMMPAILELERAGFLMPMARDARFYKKDNAWHVALRPAAGRKAGRRPPVDPMDAP